MSKPSGLHEGLTYDAVGATAPAERSWTAAPAGYRRYETTTCVGSGDDDWAWASMAVLHWAVKTRSGFEIDGAERAYLGGDVTLLARIGPFRLREPARVVAVVEEPSRCGFAYGTRAGHPVCGEEAFVVHRSADGSVWLTLRSLTRPGAGAWRLAFPAVLVAQLWYRRRYQRALLT